MAFIMIFTLNTIMISFISFLVVSLIWGIWFNSLITAYQTQNIKNAFLNAPFLKDDFHVNVYKTEFIDDNDSIPKEKRVHYREYLDGKLYKEIK